MIDQLKIWDRELFIYLNNLGGNSWNSFWLFITDPLSWVPLYILMVVMFFRYFKRKNAFLILGFYLLNLIVTLVFTHLVKNWVDRIRPNNTEALSHLIRILQQPVNYSFFSGHTATSMAVTTFFVFTFRKRFKWVYALYIWPLLFALSRIFVGVHYPSDLLVGALVGFVFGAGVHYLCLFLIQKRDGFKDKPIDHKF